MLINIQGRRKELGLTLEEVARMVGVGKGTVKKWESGYIKNMRRDKILLLAQALQVSPLDILDIPQTPQNRNSGQIARPATDEYKTFLSDFFNTDIPDSILIFQQQGSVILKKLSEKDCILLENILNT